MDDIIIQRAKEEDAPYIEEKLKKYLLDSENASREQFFVAKNNNKTVAFARIKDYGEYFELASLGVDYCHRKKGIGTKMVLFLIEEAKRRNPQKPIYGVTHRPNFVERVGFKEIPKGPEALEYKRHHRTVLGPKKNKIMLFKA
ncbi:MAG: GNAT family N-acetyltransferase [Candidatus Omnitrophica bacterium]|nr:GNAT family N-acetyltransferase [Candidatus Omnitrophota bacterium]